ncbi:anti-sigma factor [Streptomyces sp. AS58]|uniref:anti-sigma factor n=1 Tax=Streptomyces sp. AS58 TaxID=1519489 RepID=UPI0006AE83B8|nr:anti-sigma factor [Streptomyces sp. AS58]
MNSMTDPHGLTGAYALHALPDAERAAFARHMADCEPCRQEAAEFAATAARLGLAATVTPGGALRERVLRRVTTVRQVPPVGRPVEWARRAGVRRAGALSRWALAACVAAASALGGTAVWQYERAQDAAERAARAEQRADALTGVLAASDAKSRTVSLPGGASGTLVVSDGRDRAVFLASGMAEAPRDKVYQLWFSDGGTMRSAGLMDPGRTGQAVLLRGPVDGAAGVGITVEPAGGSEQPTSEPIALMEMPA